MTHALPTTNELIELLPYLSEHERAELDSLLRPIHPVLPLATFNQTKIEVQYGDDAALVPFELWPAQRDALEAMAAERLVVFAKARQLGISWVVDLYILWLCTQHDGRTVIVLSQGKFEAAEIIRRIGVLHHNHAADLPALAVENKGELEWTNGSRVFSIAATERAGRTFTAALVVLEEFAFMADPAATYNAIKPTINDGGKLFVVSSGDGEGTMYHRFVTAARERRNGFRLIFLAWTSNPTRGPGWRAARLLESLDGEASEADIKRENPETIEEMFSNAVGLVYDTWGAANISESADYLPDGGPIYWWVDDGYAGQKHPDNFYTAESHPRVFLLVQERADGRLCVFGEHHAIKMQSPAHIDAVLAYQKDLCGGVTIDPEYAAVDKSAAELKGLLLDSYEIYTKNGPGDVEESIKVVRRFVSPDANGWRRVLVHPRCTMLIREMVLYRRDEHGKIIKAFDHSQDALRYGCWRFRQG